MELQVAEGNNTIVSGVESRRGQGSEMLFEVMKAQVKIIRKQVLKY